MRLPFSTLILTAALSSMAAAADLQLKIVGLDSAESPPVTPVYHVFGGRETKVDLLLTATAGSKVDVNADLFQKAQSLAAPLQKDVPLATGVDFTGLTQKQLTVTLRFPKLQRITQVIAKFQFKADGNWKPAGQAIFIVYPAGFAKEELKEIAAPGRWNLFGDDKRLKDFFKSQDTGYEDAGPELPNKPDAQRVYIGVAKQKNLAQWLTAHPALQGNLIVFVEDANLLPGVYPAAGGEGRLTKVTLPMLATLSTDPRSQKTLLEILKAITTTRQAP